MTDKNWFLHYWGLGYRRLCPITPPGCPVSERSSFHKRLQAGDDARGKAPGRLWGDGTWSGFDFVAHEATEADCVTWHGWGAGVGIKTGRGLVLIDADTRNEDHAKIIRDTIVDVLGFLPPVRIGQYPKAGYVVRTDETLAYMRVEFGERDQRGRLKDRVEILSEGRQFVAHGIHPGTKKPYRWPQACPPASDLPFASAETLVKLLDALRGLLPAAGEMVREGSGAEVDQKTLLGDMALVRKAVEATPNTSALFPTREAWLKFGYAIKAAAGGDNAAEAFDLWAAWSARWEEGENDPLAVESEWGRMKGPFKVGASYLFETAEAAGGTLAFSVAEKWFEQPSTEAPLFPENLPNVFGSSGPFRFTPLMEAARDALGASAAPLIKGLLDQGAMTVLYGESNAGKTFVAMDMAFHIAAGLQWAGRRVAQLPVLYIAAEGGQGARKRAAAIAARYAEPASSAAFHYLLHPINLLRADADLPKLVASIRECGVTFGMIVVDTLSRAMSGGDENSSVDMGAMVKHLDALRSATRAHVLVVHHSGKDRARGARGHSLLRAATDTEIEVADRQISVTKQRDLDGAWSSAFVLDVVTLGVDSDGDPVSSCVVKLVDAGSSVALASVPTAGERDILGAIEELEGFNDEDEEGVSAVSLAKFMVDRGDNMSVNAVRVMLKKMVAKRILTKNGRGFWKADKMYVVQSGPPSGPNVFA